MRKATAILTAILLGFVFAGAGCETARSLRKEVELRGTDRLQAKDWLHSADKLYQIKDYELAQEFYIKVAEAYPNTSYGKYAKKRALRIAGLLKSKRAIGLNPY